MSLKKRTYLSLACPLLPLASQPLPLASLPLPLASFTRSSCATTCTKGGPKVEFKILEASFATNFRLCAIFDLYLSPKVRKSMKNLPFRVFLREKPAKNRSQAKICGKTCLQNLESVKTPDRGTHKLEQRDGTTGTVGQMCQRETSPAIQNAPSLLSTPVFDQVFVHTKLEEVYK